MFGRFLEGWRLADDDESLLRAARLVAEGTRAARIGWVELLDEEVAAPARSACCEVGRTASLDEVKVAFLTVIGLAPQMFTWLSCRYLEQRSTQTIVDGFEQFLSTRNLAPIPEPQARPRSCFVDLSGSRS